MLILQTAEAYPPSVSGIPEVVSQISRRLSLRGHEVHVAAGAEPGCASEEVLDGVTVHRFAVRGSEVLGIRGDAAAYLEFVRSRRWDVIVSHCSQVWSTDLLLGEEFAGPTVFVAHGLSSCDDPMYRQYYLRVAEWLRGNRVMVSLSRTGVEDGAFLAEHHLQDSVVIPNGIDPLQWSSAPVGVRSRWKHDGHPWLVNISTHQPGKGHSRLFALMRALRGRLPGALLTQIGRSYPAARYDLGRRFGVKGGCYYNCMAKSLLNSSVELRCDVSRQDTISALQEADLMVLTSRWEASPLSILECMAAGIPYVTFDVGCVREHVGGVVVETPAEMADAVCDILSTPGKREELGAQGQRRIAERHHWDAVVDQYEQLFSRLTTVH